MSLIEIERVIHEVAERSPDGVLVTSAELDPPGPEILYANPAFTQLTGYSVDEVLGKTPRILQGARTSRSVLNELRTCLEANRPFFGETFNYRKDGSEFVMQWTITPILDDQGQVVRWLAVQRDVSRSRRNLQVTQEKLQAVLSTAPDFLLILSPEGEIEFINRPVAGAREEDILGQSAFGFVEPEFHDELRENIQITVQTGEITSCEFIGLGPDGGKARYSTRLGPYLVEQEIRGVVCVSTDITMQRAAEEKARRAEAELSRILRLASVSEMTAVLAHEINQPLSSISNFAHGASKALADGAPSEDLVAILDNIEKQALYAGGIVNSLKRYVLKSNGERETVDPLELTHEAVDFLRLQIKAAGVNVSLRAAEELPLISVERVQIKQVLVNLLQNSLEALGQSQVQDPRVEIQIETDDCGLLTIQVADNGPGMPDEVLKHAFEPFFSTKEAGLGMGLNISRGIAESHQGSMCAASSAAGAVFSLVLPSLPKPAAAD